MDWGMLLADASGFRCCVAGAGLGPLVAYLSGFPIAGNGLIRWSDGDGRFLAYASGFHGRGGIPIFDGICRRWGLRGSVFCLVGGFCLFGGLALEFVAVVVEHLQSPGIGEKAVEAAAEDLIIPFGFLQIELLFLFLLAEALVLPELCRVGSEGYAVAEL